MNQAQDSLTRLRRLAIERRMADTSRASSDLRKACALLEKKKDGVASIEEGREAISDKLSVPQDARWLAHMWEIDRKLSEDLQRVREEVSLAESSLTRLQESLSERKRELALAQARLAAAQNLSRKRRRNSLRRRERRAEEEVSGIRTRCL